MQTHGRDSHKGVRAGGDREEPLDADLSEKDQSTHVETANRDACRIRTDRTRLATAQGTPAVHTKSLAQGQRRLSYKTVKKPPHLGTMLEESRGKRKKSENRRKLFP